MHFNGDISLGAVAIVFSVIIGMLKLSSNLSKMVTTMQTTLSEHGRWIKDHEECNQRQVAALADLRDKLGRIGEDLSYLKGVSDAKVQQAKVPQLQDRY